QRVARGLGKAMVERPASGAADLIEDAVEYFSSLLVLIEALIQEVAEKAAALRHAPGGGGAQARRRVAGRRVVFHEAHEIARAGQPETDDARVGAAVDDVVDAAGLEAAVERDRAALDKAPLRARNQLASDGRILPHGHHVLGAVGIDHGIRL